MDVYVKTSGQRGLGVYAGRPFTRGEVVLRATGTVIDHQTEHSIQIGWNAHLEADPPARLLNHSCEPNVGVHTNARGWPDFVALRDIQEGEEIVYDYAMTEYRHYERPRPELEFDLTCRCGSPHCRGKLGYYAELSAERKEAYRGYISDYLLEKPPEDRDESE